MMSRLKKGNYKPTRRRGVKMEVGEMVILKCEICGKRITKKQYFAGPHMIKMCPEHLSVWTDEENECSARTIRDRSAGIWKED